MHHPALDPSTQRPAPPPGYTLGRILVVNALVVVVGFAAGVLLARSYHRLGDLAARARDRMGGHPRRPADGPGTGSDSTLMRP